MKTAILQVADTGPLESLVLMLNSAGYGCMLPDRKLINRLKEIGCDTVLAVNDLCDTPSYEHPMPLPTASIADMESADLYVDVKAHRNGPKVWEHWPNLQHKTLWYRINGCYPEHVINERGDHGNEVDPPCPVLTPNMWYGETKIETTTEFNEAYRTYKPAPWANKSYACWPPFHRWHDYYDTYGRTHGHYDEAICLINNLPGWGYAMLQNRLCNQGIKFYGSGCIDGELPHDKVKSKLHSAIAMVHLKSNDAPGYALYEALAAGCPCVVSRRLIWRSHMESLFIPGETCLVFDQPTHDSLTVETTEKCYEEIRYALWELDSTAKNIKIGMAGRDRLWEIMWNAKRDGASFKEFMTKHFGGQ